MNCNIIRLFINNDKYCIYKLKNKTEAIIYFNNYFCDLELHNFLAIHQSYSNSSRLLSSTGDIIIPYTKLTAALYNVPYIKHDL